ncbi:MAG TPA: pyridoxamine 5'-phosphate oxidase family protein [Azospirillum sp.]|nr:pyridoxamine 5'-phosphate oxidase family protein [Azospirillum sp.]
MGDTAPGDLGRRILRATDRAILASAQHDSGGWPYPSLVLAAADLDGTPILFISTLADHTRNIAAEARVGLLFSGPCPPDTPLDANPLSGPRVSLLGRAVRSEEPRHRARFLARHPASAVYKGFADFAVYTVRVERAHVVTGLATGFARSVWVDGADLLLDRVPPALAEGEAELVEALNRDHGDALQAAAPAADGGPWTVTGADPEGCDLRSGGAVARIDFNHRVDDVEGVRAALARRLAPSGVAAPPPA